MRRPQESRDKRTPTSTAAWLLSTTRPTATRPASTAPRPRRLLNTAPRLQRLPSTAPSPQLMCSPQHRIRQARLEDTLSHTRQRHKNMSRRASIPQRHNTQTLLEQLIRPHRVLTPKDADFDQMRGIGLCVEMTVKLKTWEGRRGINARKWAGRPPKTHLVGEGLYRRAESVFY